MAAPSLEERVAALETEMAALKARLNGDREEPTTPWWDRIFGTFAGSEAYEEAMRLGREYRESQRPRDDDGT